MHHDASSLTICLLIAAAAQPGIARLNLFLVRLLGWKENLDRLPLLIREVFHVHAWFISVTLAAFGPNPLRLIRSPRSYKTLSHMRQSFVRPGPSSRRVSAVLSKRPTSLVAADASMLVLPGNVRAVSSRPSAVPLLWRTRRLLKDKGHAARFIVQNFVTPVTKFCLDSSARRAPKLRQGVS
jgi:hypothetical protein